MERTGRQIDRVVERSYWNEADARVVVDAWRRKSERYRVRILVSTAEVNGVSPAEMTLDHDLMAAWSRDRAAGLASSINPDADHFFCVRGSLRRCLAIGHASGQIGHFDEKQRGRFQACAPSTVIWIVSWRPPFCE